MKMPQHCQHANTDRKSLKPQVERRRRERINRSLENLKTLLLTPQGASGRRLEKAEILEHTVVFLQQHANKVREKQVLPSYQHGFSSCLQRAVHFLQTEGKGLSDSPSSSSTASSSSPSSSWPSGSPPALGAPSSSVLRNTTPQKRPSTAGSLWRPFS
ncbi:transcription factor HES-7.1-A-like [Phycodurus eques]|uniref:transcription factor HES-7.1-A-like n=1 Tax=Phycodurus eques TaxID=693459 RepID=UPI002ACD5FBC|nr:transcription factor HES-7.1-A-like [Phycodurus eques]